MNDIFHYLGLYGRVSPGQDKTGRISVYTALVHTAQKRNIRDQDPALSGIQRVD